MVVEFGWIPVGFSALKRYPFLLPQRLIWVNSGLIFDAKSNIFSPFGLIF